METPAKQYKHKVILQAIIFGLIFGFLLQKGGVAKYHVLIGQLRLTDFTVMKVMLSAILVAMIGLHVLRSTGKIKFHIKAAKIFSNITGGLIFGIGFACAGYCPGTGAAGLGQGDLPAIIFMTGMIAGSYLYAESSKTIKETIDKLANKEKLTLHTALRMNTGKSVALFTIIIVSAFIVLEKIRL